MMPSGTLGATSPDRMTSVEFVRFYFAWRFLISAVDKRVYQYRFLN